MASSGHGLPKVSAGLAMTSLTIPCGRATPETALRQNGQPAAVFYTFGHPTPYTYAYG
jgi:hypothetical protein